MCWQYPDCKAYSDVRRRISSISFLASCIAIILYAYIKDTALCIGKATNPFLVFVAPRFFEFYILGFGNHHIIIHYIS